MLDTRTHVHVVVCKLILVISLTGNLPLQFYWSHLINWSRDGAVINEVITGEGA